MSLNLALEHPENAKRFPPLRLALIGATLVTTFGRSMSSIQALPDREAAKAHLERVLRLRRDEGYRILETTEVDGDEVEPVDDPLSHVMRHDPALGRSYVDFVEDPLSAEQVAEVVARLVALAPASLDHLRNDQIPSGLLAAALVGHELPSVKALVFDATLPVRNPRLPLDDLADFFAVLPNLERVSADGWFTLRAARHETITELHLYGKLPRGTIVALADGDLPALTTLGLTLEGDHDLDARLAAALRSLDAPRLRAIRLKGIKSLARFLAELTELPLPAPWVMLYLEGSIVDEDELLTVLRERALALRSIAMLGLPLADELSESGVDEVRTLLPEVVDVCDLPPLWPPEASAAW